MVNTFSELNRGMENTGTFTMTRKSLFQLVAAANTTLADVILRLGLLERSAFSAQVSSDTFYGNSIFLIYFDSFSGFSREIKIFIQLIS